MLTIRLLSQQVSKKKKRIVIVSVHRRKVLNHSRRHKFFPEPSVIGCLRLEYAEVNLQHYYFLRLYTFP